MIGLLIFSRNVTSFPIPSMVSLFLDQIVVPDRIYRVFNRFGATGAVELDISKASDRVWLAIFLLKIKSYGVSRRILGLILSFMSNRRLQVVLDGKSSQVNAGIPQSHLNTLYSKCDKASDLWQQLVLSSEFKSDLRDPVYWGKKSLLISMLERLNLFV